jgi:hypothetical protein
VTNKRADLNNLKFSGKKVEVAELLTNPNEILSITEVCSRAGISRNTFYRWMDNPDYRDYINKLIDSYTDSENANIWKALINKAVSGDVAAQKLYFELKDKYRNKVEMSGNVVIFSGEDDIPL